jgi:hypothetical protein
MEIVDGSDHNGAVRHDPCMCVDAAAAWGPDTKTELGTDAAPSQHGVGDERFHETRCPGESTASGGDSQADFVRAAQLGTPNLEQLRVGAEQAPQGRESDESKSAPDEQRQAPRLKQKTIP